MIIYSPQKISAIPMNANTTNFIFLPCVSQQMINSITIYDCTQTVVQVYPLPGNFYTRKYDARDNISLFMEIHASNGVGGKSVRQADVSGRTHFPRKFCPTGQDILG